MKELNIQASFIVYEHVNELSEDARNLMNNAILSRNNAYAPYSKFRVGAALLLDNRIIITGNNQENASYPSGLCAERVAIYSAGANYPGSKIEMIAITATSDNHSVKEPVPSCGACRQAMLEYEINQKKPIPIYFMGEEGNIIKTNSVKNILPLIFDSSFL
ncbi:cytidine deaminase [Leptobacterium sp. I13]|uniref:cytidine deaminase n=1 Tax=Leptobacterium meishanense TaxID=3128904 RepID=UPI0030EF367F